MSSSLKKLASFSDSHLSELSADMHDELQRRLSGTEGPLPPRSDIHWKRNDARKHVGLLPDSRFRDICRDLVTEQERRYPDLKTGPTYPLADSIPMSASFRRHKSHKQVSSVHPSEHSPNESSLNESSLNEHSLQDRSLHDHSNEDYGLEEPSFNRSLNDSSFSNSERSELSDLKGDSSRDAETSRESSLTTNKSKKPDLSVDTDLNEPSLQIQSVLESSVTPTKVKMFESESESDSDEEEEHPVEQQKELHDEQQEPEQEPEQKPEQEPYEHKELQNEQPEQPEKLEQPEKHEQSKELEQPEQSAEPLASVPEETEKIATVQSPDTEQNTLPSHSTPVKEVENTSKDISSKGVPSTEPASSSVENTDRSVDNAANNAQAEQLRSEAARYLAEMRELTKRHDEQVERARKSDAESARWRHKYAKAVTKLEKFEHERKQQQLSEPHLNLPDMYIPQEFVSREGKLDPKQLSTFFDAIGRLVAAVHAFTPSSSSESLLNLLHNVVVSARSVQSGGMSNVNRAANQLITVVRNYTVTQGLFPRILVDSACSDITTAILERAKEVKVNAPPSMTVKKNDLSTINESDTSASSISNVSASNISGKDSDYSNLSSTMVNDDSSASSRNVSGFAPGANAGSSYLQNRSAGGPDSATSAARQPTSETRNNSNDNVATNSGSAAGAATTATAGAATAATAAGATGARAISERNLPKDLPKDLPKNLSKEINTSDGKNVAGKLNSEFSNQAPSQLKGLQDKAEQAHQIGSDPKSKDIASSAINNISKQDSSSGVSGNASKALGAGAGAIAGAGAGAGAAFGLNHAGSGANSNDASESRETKRDFAPQHVDTDRQDEFSSGVRASGSSASTMNSFVSAPSVMSQDSMGYNTPSHSTAFLNNDSTPGMSTYNDAAEATPTIESNNPAATPTLSSVSDTFDESAMATPTLANTSQKRPPSSGTTSSDPYVQSPTSARSVRRVPTTSDRFRQRSVPNENEVSELQRYVEEKTSGTVDAIGELLSGIKSNAPAKDLKVVISHIQVLVGGIIEHFKATMAKSQNQMLKEKGTFLVDNLEHCTTRMGMLRTDELDQMPAENKPNRHLKQRLAGVSYDMAKCTKELVKTVEYVALNNEVNDIDRQLE